MIVIRSLVFNTTFYLWTLVACLAIVWTLPFPRGVLMGCVRFYLATIHLLEKHVLGLDYRVEGLERVPPAPYILAAKHQSTWETMKLHRILARDDPAVVLKQELMWIPFWGWYAARARMIAVNRAGRGKAMHSLLTAARQRAADGRAIAIFPQGTRVAPGTWQPYRAGTFALYEALDLPVVPMALNSGVFWPRRRFLKQPGTITVRFLPPIEPGLDRHAFRHRLEDALEDATDALVVAAGGPPAPRPPHEAPEGTPQAAAAGQP